MTAWMSPPVTMLAVPIVRRTKPQKMPACIRPARDVLEHLRLDERVLDQADEPGRDVRERARAAGSDRGEHAQVPGHREAEEGGRAPEDREDQQVRRDVGERLEHGQAVAAVVERARERLEGMVEDRGDRVE